MNKTRVTTHPIDFILERIAVNLQISPILHGLAEDKYNAVGSWLAEKSGLAKYKPKIYPQGSLKIGTTIKPIGREEYDLDLVCEFENVSNTVEPNKLLEAVMAALNSNPNYASLTEPLKRCVRLNYKGQFHLDILPAIPNINDSGACVLVPDREANGGIGGWKPSNPKGYADWFNKQSEIPIEKISEMKNAEPLPEHEDYYEKEPLQCAVQLLKRWRNNVFKGNDHSPVSIVLTTLAASQYKKEVYLSDAMTSILNGINTLNSNGLYNVVNPTTQNPKEIFSEKWIKKPESFRIFIAEFAQLTRLWNEMLVTRGPALEGRLELLFGNNDGIIKKAYTEYANAISEIRKSGDLGTRKTGVISTLGAGVVGGSKNTFHGD